MKKIFERNQTIFSVLWIVIYVVSLSIADNISRSIGVEKLITLPVSILLFIVIIVWISKNNLRQYYGLCLIKGFDFKKYLYFLPLVIISTPNLWNGVTMRFTVKETILYALSMIMVGFLEEIIFRGMLFQALKIENVYRAIIVSSLMFGVGHIVNLLNGGEFFSTMLQICYASAIGYVFTIIFYKGKTLFPCIISHIFINVTNVFLVEKDNRFEVFISVVIIIVSVLYGVYLSRDIDFKE